MFAFDTLMPINTLFVLVILLCLYACIAGLTQTRESDEAEGEIPPSFRDMPGLTDISAGSNGHAHDGAQRGRQNGTSKGRGK